MSHEREEARGLQDDGLPPRVRPADDQRARARREPDVDRDDAASRGGQRALEKRMAGLPQEQGRALADRGTLAREGAREVALGLSEVEGRDLSRRGAKLPE